MPSSRAAFSALARSREAMAAISVRVPRCMAGMTLTVAILATPRTPQRILLDMTEVGYRGWGCGAGDVCFAAAAAEDKERIILGSVGKNAL